MRGRRLFLCRLWSAWRDGDVWQTQHTRAELKSRAGGRQADGWQLREAVPFQVEAHSLLLLLCACGCSRCGRGSLGTLLSATTDSHSSATRTATLASSPSPPSRSQQQVRSASPSPPARRAADGSLYSAVGRIPKSLVLSHRTSSLLLDDSAHSTLDSLPPALRLAVHVAHELRLGPHSRWHVYLASCPTEEVPVALLWDDGEASTWLEGTQVECEARRLGTNRVCELRASWGAVANENVDRAVFAISTHRQRSLSSLSSPTRPLPRLRPSPEHTLSSRLVRSRSTRITRSPSSLSPTSSTTPTRRTSTSRAKHGSARSAANSKDASMTRRAMSPIKRRLRS